MSLSHLSIIGSTLMLLAAVSCPGADAPPAAWRVYIGTYTGAKSKGIHQFRLDLATGRLEAKGLAAEVTNPTFLAVHPNGRLLYAASEVANYGAQKTGAVCAYSIDAATGALTALNQRSSGGAGACHLTVDRAGRNVLVANYGGGTVAVLPIEAGGKLKEPTCVIQHQGKGPNPRRQERPHAHSINLDPANRFAIAADLGLDKLMVYRFDPEAGKLAANDPPFVAVASGAGPRHFAFHPDGKHAYVINEMGNTVTAFTYDAAGGRFTEIHTVPALPADFAGSSTTAEVQVHPSGKFLYGSNRGHDSIAMFSIDPATGRLTPMGHAATGGKTPRNFGIDPTGAYLIAANQGSDNLVVFRIDPATGRLAPTGTTAEVGAPVCIKFVRE